MTHGMLAVPLALLGLSHGMREPQKRHEGLLQLRDSQLSMT